MQWIPTNEEITFYKQVNRDEDSDDNYYKVMLPLLLEKVNEDYEQSFEHDKLPANVKMFLALAIAFYGSDIGLTGEKMGTVSYSYDFTALPTTITDLLSGYDRKAKKVRFYASW